MRKSVAPGVYFHEAKGYFYFRPWVNGRRTERVLEAKTLREALKEYHRRLNEPQGLATVGELTQLYLDAGAPGRSGVAGKTDFLEWERYRAKKFLPFFERLRADDLRIATCLAYKDWRARQIQKGRTGLRSIDMELGTLSNVLNFAVLKGELDVNRILGRPRFRAGAEVSHCRDHCPTSGDDLHRLAYALEDSLAWQMLFEACSGCRTNEARSLRWDAKECEPGHIRSGQYLCISRLKQGHNDPFDYIRINAALKDLLRGLKKWREVFYPDSPFFFPSPRRGNQCVSNAGLSLALRRVVPKTLPGQKVTSHGMRAFYVTWRRVTKVPIHQIAEEVGHRSGVSLIYSTYGRKVPPWATSAFSPRPSKKVVAFWDRDFKASNVVRMVA